MKQMLWTAGALMVLVATAVSCDKIKPPQPEVQPPSAASEQAKPAAERQAFSQAVQKELDELRSVIAGLKVKAESANAQVKARLGEELKKLEGEWTEAQQRLTALKSATLESWSEVKESFSKSLDKLKTGIENIRKNAA
jgi:chromosome segregation ATPase